MIRNLLTLGLFDAYTFITMGLAPDVNAYPIPPEQKEVASLLTLGFFDGSKFITQGL